MTNMTFEVFCFLVLNKNLLVIKISVAVPAPRLHLLLLLAAHPVAVSFLERSE